MHARETARIASTDLAKRSVYARTQGAGHAKAPAGDEKMTTNPSMNAIVTCLLILTLVPGAMAATTANAVTIACDFPGEMIEAGETATFDLTVTNMGDMKTCALNSWTYFDDTNWKIRFVDDDRDVYKMYLPAQESKTIRLVVESPGYAPVGEYPIRVGVGDGKIWLYIRITQTHSGETGNLVLTAVDKEGAVVKGADVGIYTGDERIEGMLTTAEGKVSIDAPMGVYTVAVTKAGYQPWSKGKVEIRIGQTTDLGIVPLDKENFYADVRVKSPSLMATVGSTPQYEIVLKNVGRADDTYVLGVEGLPDQWYARFKEAQDATEDLTEAYMPAGDEKTLYLEVIPPYSVGVGEYNLTAVIQSAARSYEENLTLRLRGTYDLQMYSPSYRSEISPGDTTSFPLTLTNGGTGGTLTNVNINISAPEGWQATVDTPLIASLGPGERTKVTMTVIPPADIVAGEYKLIAQVKCDQAEEKDEFRVVVQEHSYIAFIGLLVVLGVVGGLWYMFRKYGRR
ncbi:NEW3 domain-containing protein [uncultured Methanofollis sp.]|uniref:NEW3 domain-containing protein n=1 Tax=uncultured Methanofollis sp. TaxID=262500 RepID=UPI0026280B8B|nr:NEW3 domain-containing protein [uncultured Methanofollis sp.]